MKALAYDWALVSAFIIAVFWLSDLTIPAKYRKPDGLAWKAFKFISTAFFGGTAIYGILRYALSVTVLMLLLCGCGSNDDGHVISTGDLRGYIVTNTNDSDWRHYHPGIDRSNPPEGYKLLTNGKKWNFQVGDWTGLFEVDSKEQAIARAWKYCDDDLEMRKYPMKEIATNSPVSPPDDIHSAMSSIASEYRQVTEESSMRYFEGRVMQQLLKALSVDVAIDETNHVMRISSPRVDKPLIVEIPSYNSVGTNDGLVINRIAGQLDAARKAVK